jgi:cell division control protein 12
MKQLSQRVNLIPVIAKADTVSPQVMPAFKEKVIIILRISLFCSQLFLYYDIQIREAIAQHGITPYTCPIDSDDEDTTKQNIDVMSSMPFALIGSMQEVPLPSDPSKKVLGRQYPWGVAEGKWLR